jgi:hypothetical protein
MRTTEKESLSDASDGLSRPLEAIHLLGRTMAHKLVIRTSERGWFAALAKAYKEETPTWVIDDAAVGFDPHDDTLFELGRRSKLSAREIVAACLAAGMSVGGWWAAVYVLTNKKPPNFEVGPQGVAFWWPEPA